MSSEQDKQNDYVQIFEKEKFDKMIKKYYGLSDKDLEEIYVFVNEFNEVLNDIHENSDYSDLKKLVDAGNKIPAHCGYIICNYYVNNNGDDKYIKILLEVYKNYKSLFNEDKESFKTTDLYEVLACLIQFAPAKTMRKFILNNFEISKEIYNCMRKRPSVNAVMSARYSELFVTSKFDEKYSHLIYENFNAMIAFLKQKNGEIDGIDDAVRINFNELRDIMKDFYEKNKKESLKKINSLINKKADIGEAFFYWILLNQSCALEVISRNENINGKFIEDFLFQLKIQYIVELAVVLQDLPSEKTTFMEYIKNAYKLEDFDACFDRLSNIVHKDSISIYGILLRQTSLYPNVRSVSDDTLGIVSALDGLQKKLSCVANNLTAGISEKSMSITIVPLGRSRTYQDIMDKIEGVDKNENSFAAKLRDKDIVKKIRESGLSWYTLDQCTGEIKIGILEALQDVYKANPSVSREEIIKLTYKDLVLKYGIIVTLPYFKYLFEEIEDKTSSNKSIDINEDYEEM